MLRLAVILPLIAPSLTVTARSLSHISDPFGEYESFGLWDVFLYESEAVYFWQEFPSSVPGESVCGSALSLGMLTLIACLRWCWPGSCM